MRLPDTAEKSFWHYLNERHRIYLRRSAGAPLPWTSDPIFQQYKFTNVFRELDRTTIWVRENIRKPLAGELELLLFNTALFRQTGASEGWQGIVRKFSPSKHAAKYVAAQHAGVKVFTGAYMVTGQFPGAKGNNKVVSLFEHALLPVWKARRRLVEVCLDTNSLQAFVAELGCFVGWRGNNFMAYEVACDLLHTQLLGNACDQFTWANPGPGAQRGLSRIFGGEINMLRGARSREREQSIAEMRQLLAQTPKKLGKHFDGAFPIDMRVIENALCETDKYERTRLGQGRPRSRYAGDGGLVGKTR